MQERSGAEAVAPERLGERHEFLRVHDPGPGEAGAAHQVPLQIDCARPQLRPVREVAVGLPVLASRQFAAVQELRPGLEVLDDESARAPDLVDASPGIRIEEHREGRPVGVAAAAGRGP